MKKQRSQKIMMHKPKYSGIAKRPSFLQLEPRQKEGRVEKQLQEAQGFFDIVRVLVVALDSEGNIVLINKKACEVLGCGKNKLIGKNWFNLFIPKKIRNELRVVFNSLMAGSMQEFEYYENPIQTLGGQERIIAWHNNLLKDNSGRIIGILSSGEDVTDHRRLEEDLKRSEDQLKLITDNLPALVSYFDSKEKYCFVNKAYERLFRHSHKAILAKTVKHMAGDRAYRILKRHIDKALSGKEVSFETEISFKDRIKRYMDVNFIPHFEKKGKVAGCISLISDITERKMLENELKESELKLKALIDYSPDGIFVKDIKGKYVLLNRKALRMVRLANPARAKIFRAIEGMDISLPIPDELLNRLTKNDVEIIKSKKNMIVQDVLMHSDKDIYLEIFKYPILDKRGKVVYICNILRDITERKRIEQLRDNFVRDVSHELKTPIAMAEMACDMWQRAFVAKDTERLKKSQGIVIDSIARLHRDVYGILDIFRFGRIRTKDIKVRVAIKKILGEILVDFFRTIKTKKLKFKVNIHSDANEIEASPKDVKILIHNVLDNAIKFTEKGSISFSSSVYGKWLRIKVKDTGCGMVLSDQKRVYDKFFKRYPSIEGTGLGLSICKEIIEKYSGKISVTSKGLGKGTLAIVDFPLKKRGVMS